MSEAGVRRAVGFICAAHRSYSSCTQYKQNVVDARAEIVAAGLRDVEVTYVGDWHTAEGFITANAANVTRAIERLPAAVRRAARIVFTAHSIPVSMSGAARYQQQLKASAGLVAEHLGTRNWALVFQSRSGRPTDPWLEPDVCDYLRREAGAGLEAVVVCPLGFLCDHIEVLHDLDREAADVCAEIGLPMVRADAVNDAPPFLDAMAEAVLTTWRQHASGRPLPLVAATPPERVEGPPPARSRSPSP
jgi:ferrochelatase